MFSKEKFGFKNLIKEAKSITLVLFIALSIRIAIFEPFFVPTGSMEDNIFVGDYIFSTKYNYGYSKYSVPFAPNIFNGRILNFNQPKRGDIVIFYLPEREMRFVKRLIGLPGDEVQMIDGFLYINGRKASKEYVGDVTRDNIKFKKYKETLPNGVQYNIINLADNEDSELLPKYRDTKVFKVPEGKFFFMGDNRDLSRDARADLPFIPAENLISKARFVWFSTSELLFPGDLSVTQQIFQVYNWAKSIRFSRVFKSLEKYNDEKGEKYNKNQDER
jgi:signal peptidase I